ncbi:GATA zinc finger domain-containing protein 8 isoform X2 [Teleopsis dalmanni]|nr:GATA zinc finger domain-containing protein 8 isoform X2 [Teleopsis dalmanni]
MNDYWHIPRASLASSSSSGASSASLSNGSNKSHSNPPTVAKRKTHANNLTTTTSSANNGQKRERFIPNGRAQGTNTRQSRAYESNTTYNTYFVGSIMEAARGQANVGTSTKKPTATHSSSHTSPITTDAATAAAAVLAAAKRGSRSSQGSSDSNNSTRSAASGSLLLTAANLERFAEIHKKQQKQNKLYLEQLPHNNMHNNRSTNPTINTTYNANLVHAITAAQHQQNNSRHSSIQQHKTHNYNNYGYSNHNDNDDAIIEIDPNLDFIKTKELDTVSIASSMHFTMVNGEGNAAKKPKRGLCDRGRQVTVLIISMSTVFMLLIMGMVYALEMRARVMPHS